MPAEQHVRPGTDGGPGDEAGAGPPGVRATLAAPGFRRLLLAQTVSSLGDWVATLAFIVSAFALTRNQAAVAVILVLRLVPPVFAAPVGGVVADRLYRRTIMVACDLTRAALVAAAPFAGIGPLYAIAFVHECISLFFLPARDASVPLLVPDGALPEANSLILATSYGSLPVAAALFGALRLAASHIPNELPFAHLFRNHATSFAFFFDAATFVFSAAMIAGLPLRRRHRDGGIELAKGLAEGFRHVLGDPRLRALASGLVVSMLGGGVLFAVGIAYVRQTLGGGDVDFGWLAALWGLGMAAGLLVVRVVSKRRGRGAGFIAAVASCGGVLLVMALAPLLWLAFVMAVVFGAAFSTAVVLALSMAQELADDQIRGRIMGGIQMLFRLGLAVGALGAGALAHAVHRITIGSGATARSLDGNQAGLIVGGILILAGAVASSGIARPAEQGSV